MIKAFYYRLYPNRKHAGQLEHLLDIGRWLYNSALEERKQAWKMQRKFLNYYDQANQLKEIRKIVPELAELNFSSCQDMLRRLDEAFRAFYRRVKKGGKVGYPRFKGRDRFNSITFPTYGDGIKLIDNKLRVQNVGLLKIKLHRPLDGIIKTVTIKRDCGKWYVVFSNVVDTFPLPSSDKEVGIDVGLNNFAVTSDGEFIDNPRWLKSSLAKLRVTQRSVSRKKLRSANRHKVVEQLAKIHQKVRNQRKDFVHKVANSIVKTYGKIAVEDLKIKNMVRNHYLARSISDVGWGQFIDILSYKAEYAGREFVKVNPNGTSQNCSICGSSVPKSLSIRIHKCPACNVTLDRDLNSALNILTLGRSVWDITCANRQCVSQEAVCFI